MKTNCVPVKAILVVSILLRGLALAAQDKGDEDRQMLNTGKIRDQQQIDQALNGWYKKSLLTHEQRIRWWRDAKFGMFIHWGVYSLPGGEWKGKKVSGYAEHLMRKEKIPRPEYLQLAHQFNPVRFNAEEWVKNAKAAGMNYLIITAKHHDGFAMYDSKVSDYNIVQQTAWKHDPMADLAAACKKYGLKFGFYYSHAFDWEHPDAPGNDWDYQNPGGDLNLHGGRNWYDLHPELLVKAQRYVNEKAIPQIKELLTKYHPDILWFDTPQKLPLSENIRILQAIRETDTNVVVNGRLVRGPNNLMMGDYKNTGDRPAEFAPVTGDWEAIPTTNESYGYSKYDSSHKSVGFFVQLLAKAASRGGNLLMNIGPKGDGTFDVKDITILKGIGAWVDRNRESIFLTKPSPLPLQSWGVTTMHDQRIYLHVFNWPADGRLMIGGLKTPIKNAWLLTDKMKKSLPVHAANDLAILSVPHAAPDTADAVIVLEFQGTAKADSTMVIANNTSTRLLGFDADLHGGGFGFGDGKAASYFVENWKSKQQSVSWKFRVAEPGTFKLVLKYVASPETEGEAVIKIGEKVFSERIRATERSNAMISRELGTVQLDKGVTTIEILPVEITKAELMKLLELQLIPANQ
ncbi:MAG: alpha-L-fucosidase [Chitinophagaceae bacterium]|nr:alpha-L-fucosidase [Chitinophagaceae bacterium]